MPVDSPTYRFLQPDVVARLGRVDLVARTVVDGFINGLHRAPFFGASIDFAEHRGYTPGDDIRHLDWKVWSKTDKFYIKKYEAETQKLGDERLAIVKELATNFSALTDAKATELLNRSVTLEEKRVALVKKYKEEMLKVLPGKTVARFVQLDSRLSKLIDLSVASEIPIVY